MSAQATVYSHVDITDTLVRLYLFLAQSMDRCISEAARISYPEAELQAHLEATRAAVLDMLSGNPVVKGKIEQEYQRVRALVQACHVDGAGRLPALNELKAERAILQHKTMALSDLLAVFRAI